MLTKMEKKTIRYTSAYPLFCHRLATTQFDSGIGPKISSVSDQGWCLMCQCCLLNVHVSHMCAGSRGGFVDTERRGWDWIYSPGVVWLQHGSVVGGVLHA